MRARPTLQGMDARTTRLVAPWESSNDPLGEALHYLRMDGAFYCRSELTEPYGATMPALSQYVWFHVVTSGETWLTTLDGQARHLVAGDIALVTRGAGHDLTSAPGEPTVNIVDIDHQMISERYEVMHLGGGGAPTQIICAAVRFGHPAARNLLEALPEVVVLQTAQAPELDRMQSTLALMAAEARSPSPGGEAVITRLADILVIQTVRAWIESDPGGRTGWLGALQDPQIGAAITRIHRDPARDWTVAALADITAMSRSAFSARFTALVGEPAMQYVTRWRMHVAVAALREEGATVGELAARLGYRSEAAFARAFKRVIGQPPGAIRAARPEDDFAIFGDMPVADPAALANRGEAPVAA